MSKETEQNQKAVSKTANKQESLMKWIVRPDRNSKRKDPPNDDAGIDDDNRDGRRKLTSTSIKTDSHVSESIDKINNHIYLNGKMIRRPNYPTSYGILLYRKAADTAEFQYLLGLIPQGNAWTVFKGLPESNERPEETAVREFEEETSLAFPYPHWEDCPIKETLYGVTSTKKLLEIYLIPAPISSTSIQIGCEFDVSKFDVDKVVRIDSGYMEGKPEIVEIRYMSKRQAIAGVAGRDTNRIAKIFKSQIGILERAEAVLVELANS
jgi:8-oxo-dGTP pyrophosphatase MutT (NUDIX family)